jgi:hypothetical protein
MTAPEPAPIAAPLALLEALHPERLYPVSSTRNITAIFEVYVMNVFIVVSIVFSCNGNKNLPETKMSQINAILIYTR